MLKKYLTESLGIGHKILSDTWLLDIPTYKIKNCPVRLSKKEKGFELQTSLPDRLATKKILSGFLTSKDTKISIGQIFNRSRSVKITPDIGTVTDTLNFYSFSSCLSKNEEPSFYRLILKSEKNFHWDHFFERAKFEYELNGHTSPCKDLIELNIQDKIFHFFKVSENDQEHIVIDSQFITDYESFAKCAYSILVGYGFFTAYLPLHEGYYIASSTLDFKEVDKYHYRSFRDSLKSFYQIINTNPFKYLTEKKDRGKADQLYGSLQIVSRKVFGTLVDHILKKPQFLVSLLLILEGNSQTLVSRPNSYSVALETVAGMISDEYKEKYVSVLNKYWKEIRPLLIKVIEPFKSVLTESEYKFLEGKVNNINQVPNKVKLRFPFEVLGIDLSEEEDQAIEKRNSFLHGEIPDTAEEESNTFDTLYVCFRLHFILNRLILKYIGFSGKMINHVKFQEESFGKQINEEVFRDV